MSEINEKLIRETLPPEVQEQKIEIEEAGKLPISRYSRTDFFKEIVAIEIQFCKYYFVAYDSFVKHLSFYAI